MTQSFWSKRAAFSDKINAFVKAKSHIVLAVILAIGAYLRIWNISHLFNVVHDYDEGVYSLAARFMLQGFQPYKDFTLVHPPLFELALSAIYRIFGYNFMYGKYFSVFLALLSIVLIFIIGKKLYHQSAGIVAALFFAVSPDMVYPGRRAVQESLGIFILLLAIYFAIEYFQKQKLVKIFICGIFLGLSIATKYIFIPSAIGILASVYCMSLPKDLRDSFKRLGTGRFWLIYLGGFSLIFSFLLCLKWIFGVPVSIPLIDPMYFSIGNFTLVLVVFFLPAVLALFLLPSFTSFKGWVGVSTEFLKRKTVWVLLGGIFIGFFTVTGYYIVNSAGAFFQQTVFLQAARPYSIFPSFLVMFVEISNAQGFLKMAFIPIFMIFPLTIIILRKRVLDDSSVFIVSALIVTFFFCQFLYHLPRYYIGTYPFIILGFVSFTPKFDHGVLLAKINDIALDIKINLFAIVGVISLLLCLSLVLLTNYTGYDSSSTFMASNEWYVYTQTVNYLEQAGAQKIYSDNPIFPALSVKLNSTLKFDTPTFNVEVQQMKQRLQLAF